MLKIAPTYFIESLDRKGKYKEDLYYRGYYTSVAPINMLKTTLDFTVEMLSVWHTVAIFKIYPTTTPLADRLKQYPSC